MYYSGHGVMDSTTKVVCNAEDTEFRYFSLESQLSIISKYQNSYVVSVFDCCREYLPTEDTRGGGEQPASKKKNQNFFCIFGCGPTNGVPAKSIIVNSFIICLNKYLNKKGGVLQIPKALDDFKRDYVP